MLFSGFFSNLSTIAASRNKELTEYQAMKSDVLTDVEEQAVDQMKANINEPPCPHATKTVSTLQCTHQCLQNGSLLRLDTEMTGR